MDQRTSRLAVAATLASLALLGGCDWPTVDPRKLKAIKVEAEALVANHPIRPPNEWASVPKQQWPPAITSLQPEFVTVHKWGVDITTKPYPDGGWGYQIAKSKRLLPMPEGCYWEMYQNVFWHGPC
jgi:hypothetical protein